MTSSWCDGILGVVELRWHGLKGIERGTYLGCQRVLYPPGFSFPFHRHDFLELFFVTFGHGFHDHDAGADALAAGDLVVVHPRFRHRVRATAHASLTFINLVVAPRLAEDVSLAVVAIPEWRQAQPPPVRRLAGTDAQVLMDHLLDLERDGDRDALSAQSFLLDLGWRLRRQDRAHGVTVPALARRLLAELEDPAVLCRGPSQIANALGCSREHLTRVSRRHLGASLVDLLAERRLDHAARLLRHTGLAVSEICRASGHRSVAHFYERFRRRFGLSPLRYREGAIPGPA